MDRVIILIFLLIGSISDIRKKQISGKYLCTFGVLAVVYLGIKSILFKDIMMWYDAVTGLVPGIVCLVMARISREQIGYGDSLVLLIVGMLLGFEDCLWGLFAAFMILTIWALILFILKKAGRKTTVPFLPFLLMGCLIQGGL